MSLVEIDSVGLGGMVKDLKPYTLDPVIWSDMLNVRTVDGHAASMLGREQVFGALPQAPYFLMPLQTPAQTFWLWMSLTDGYVWNDSVHTEITRVSGDYSATAARDWNGTILGGIPVINNGVDIPQVWLTPTIVTKLTNLANWNTNWRARVIRAFGPFLIAINITKSGVASPHMVKWSHPADPGSVPSSWDETDETVDAGESELPDVDSGVLLDAAMLRGQMFLYKGGSTWRMRYIGGQNIFAFDTFLDTAGLLATRCVGIVGDGLKHFVVTQDDVIVHNGNAAEPILSKRARRYLFNQIDVSNFANSFVFANYEYTEMWFCYPENGLVQPSKAIVWNWSANTVYEADIDFVAASNGAVASSDTSTWNGDPNEWDTDLTGWSVLQRRKTLVAKSSNSKILQMDSGLTYDGTAPTCRLQRTGLAIIGRKRDRTPIVDFNRRKMITRVWPRIVGAPVNVRIGGQDDPEGGVRWTDYDEFTPGVDQSVDLITEGAALAIEFQTQAAGSWTLEGYKPDIEVIGEF